ncbi:unnamed protein product [Phytophthora lilii]|uniref:Unnamed protein product n=1 Tax=Phytophthora lilii TaxID=2077276 RepID=A0A9W6TGV1_9STRA|nr:unnamed protein product [Phytophthora lilii]
MEEDATTVADLTAREKEIHYRRKDQASVLVLGMLSIIRFQPLRMNINSFSALNAPLGDLLTLCLLTVYFRNERIGGKRALGSCHSQPFFCPISGRERLGRNPRFSDASLSIAMTTAWDLWAARDSAAVVLPSGCDSIDELLGGGFRSGILTEICGEASAGKTQLCLQLLLQCCLPRALGGLQGTACYICTEGVGSVKRLHDLAQVYARRYGAVMGVGAKRKRGEAAPKLTGSDFLDGIFVEQLYTVDDLMDLVVGCKMLLSQV